MPSLGTWPSTIKPASCRLQLQSNQRAAASPGGGSEQVVDMLNDRWMMSLTLPSEDFARAAAVEAFLASFRGLVNWAEVWHFARPQPRGTLRGTLTTSGAQAQGAAQLVLAGGTNGQTILAGDVIGAGGQLLMAAGDAIVTAGVITIPLVNRLRAAIAAGQPAVWDKPTAPFRIVSHSGVGFSQGVTGEVQVELAEVIL